MRTPSSPPRWDAQQQAGEVAGVVDEAVSGVRVVKGFGQEERELDRLADAAGDLFRLAGAHRPPPGPATSRCCRRSPASAQVAVLALGGWLAIDGNITLGHVPGVLHLPRPARRRRCGCSPGCSASASRPGPAPSASSTCSTRRRIVDREARRRRRCRDVHGEVELRRRGFGYLTRRAGARRLRPRVAPGETVALVGTSGSGKSTVALLLPRFYDVAERRGPHRRHDVRDVTLDSLRRQIGVVFEEASCSPTSVARQHRLRPARRHRRRDRGRRPGGRGARLHRRRCPTATTPSVGERGLTLSGGQRQRIALARALLTDPAHPGPRRRHLGRRRRDRGGDPRHAARGDGAAARPCSWPTAARRCGWPTASSCSTTAGWSTSGTHEELMARCRAVPRAAGRPRRRRRDASTPARRRAA